MGKLYAGPQGHPTNWNGGTLYSSVADPDPNPDPSDPYFLGLRDLDTDPLVRGMDPDPSIIKQK